MKIPLSWLREWVDLPQEPRVIADRLTSLGFEVEALERAAPEFNGVVVGAITAIAPHPQADKLRVCTVDAGTGAPLQIVCGAPNARVGLKTALAQLGATLPGDLKIKAARLRGVDSSGMLCSPKELGMPADIDGIMELAADAPVGTDLRQYLDLDDWTFEIAVTPNRGDAMSVLGIARELAAATRVPLKSPDAADPMPATADSAAGPAVRLTPGAGCGRFASRVIRGIRRGVASPRWLQERLRRAGLRSISPVVDVTNLVLLELGQPMHAYDLVRLHGTVTARRATAGEAVKLLDDRELKVDADVAVIADDSGIVGLAGIMGGERTAIGDTTQDLFLEVAWFEPAAIAGRARRYGILTDASQRFERGVDPALQERALARATQLILQLVGGTASELDVQHLKQAVPLRAPVRLRPPRLARLLGREVASDEIRNVLASLGMKVAAEGENFEVTPPSWRFDLRVEADLIEEVARSVGFGSIPEQPASGQRRLRAAPESRIDERAVLQLMAARGYHEIVSFGFVDPVLQRQVLGDQKVVTLRNPIASDLAVMRLSLWPGLLRAASQNLRRQVDRCKLLELASVFTPGASGATTETARIGGLAVGPRLPEQWGSARAGFDFHDLKSDVESLLALAGPGAVATFEPCNNPPPALHPGRCAEIVRDGARIGLIGELHPTLGRTLEIEADVQLFELDYAAITTAHLTVYQPLSPFPQVRRDLSFVVDAGESFSRIAVHVSVAASNRLRELRIFDVYSGKGIESGRKSIALGLILQDLSRTLTDQEADETVASVIASLKSGLNARLRE
jgi:phenylalanyl-tRNA synthetase beta chain